MAPSCCFPPLLAPQTRVLVLGSLPGQASLAAGQYYAHPRNQFWRLLGDIIGQPLATLPYPERVASMLAAGVGLWDVVQSAERPGSLDADLRAVTYNDLRSQIGRLPQLAAVAFNGATAARAARHLAGLSPSLLRLPSSSPAMTMAYADKLAVWREIGRYL